MSASAIPFLGENTEVTEKAKRRSFTYPAAAGNRSTTKTEKEIHLRLHLKPTLAPGSGANLIRALELPAVATAWQQEGA